MATAIGIGKSTRRNAFQAGLEAARAAAAELHGRRPDHVLVFGLTGYDQQPLLDGVMEATGGAPLSGCAAEGVITQAGADEGTHGVSVMAFASDEIRMRGYHVTDAGRDPVAAARALADQIAKDPVPDPRLLLLFPDGLSINCAALLAALEPRLPGVLIAGGASACILDSFVTWQYHAGKVYQGSVSAVLIGGAVAADVAVSHGCEPIGNPRTITRAEGPHVLEIDGKAAFAAFKEYLDGDPDDLTTADVVHLCVGVELPPGEAGGFGKYVVRAPLALRKADGAIAFGAEFEQGTRIQMARRDPEQICDGAAALSRAIAARHPGERPLLVLQFDCAGRGRMLFGEKVTELAVEPMQRTFGKDLPWLGFHTYGEIAPLARKTWYHNYTVVLCALYPGHG